MVNFFRRQTRRQVFLLLQQLSVQSGKACLFSLSCLLCLPIWEGCGGECALPKYLVGRDPCPAQRGPVHIIICHSPEEGVTQYYLKHKNIVHNEFNEAILYVYKVTQSPSLWSGCTMYKLSNVL